MQIHSSPSTDQPRSPGILRLNRTPRSMWLGPTSPSLTDMQVGPSSPSQPQPLVSRQSVTFAIVESERNGDLLDRGAKSRGFAAAEARSRYDTQQQVSPIVADSDWSSRNPPSMENSTVDSEENGNEHDYSASACAILQRRNSSHRQSRRRRRPSSPFGGDNVRRRSSAYTTSSGDTIISMEESGTQEQIYENLKLHKEMLSGVKQQPWPFRRKIKLVRQAKAYVRRHEGALQERLAQSRNTKDVIARVSFFMTKKWQYFRRELINLQTWLIPWEVRIKEIESHFGSAVASYFIFLRWLFWINLVIATTLTAFVAIPGVLTADATLISEREKVLKEERVKSKLLTLWEFEGVLKYSPFFYGWYTNQDSHSNYKLPLAYFVTNLVVYAYSFVAILRKMAENSRMSKLTEKEEEYIFSWKLFTTWDFMIGNPETAHNRSASIVLGFKEALLEEAEKEKDERNWRIISIRIFVNVAVLSLLALSAYAVVEVVGRSTTIRESQNWWRQNEITIVMSLITYVFPIFFEILGFLESYHPRKQLRMQLGRIMVLNLLNLYSLIIALFNKIDTMKKVLNKLITTNTSCEYKIVSCDDEIKHMQQFVTMASLIFILMGNVTHSQTKREIVESPLPVQKPFYLNPPYVDTSHEDFNNTLDGNYNDDYSRVDHDSYQYNTSEANNISESYTTKSYLEEDTRREDNSMTRHDTSSIVTTDFSTDSIDVEDLYSSSVSLHSKIASTSITSASNRERSSTAEFDITSSSMAVDVTSSTDAYATYISKNDVSTVEPNEHVTPLPKQNYTVICFEKICTATSLKDLVMSWEQLDSEIQKKLRQSCWETMFGQELAKLTVMDLILTIVATLSVDFFRALFVRFMNSCWCWDLEKQFPQYGDFKIAENILHLVYNQGMVWMGMFFSPGLTALNLLKLGILMYLRSWAVLTCNVPHEVVFRASRSNNFYFLLLLAMLFLCVLPVGYAIVRVEPSRHCGPFSSHPKIYNVATQNLTTSLPEPIKQCLDYIASPGIVIPLIVLMTLIICYMVSLAGSLREANNDLKIQLRHERTEERRKLFKIAEKRQNVVDTPLTRWKKILPALPQTRTELLRNLKVSQQDDAQIATENSNDTLTEKQRTVDAERNSLDHSQVSFSGNVEKGNKGNEEEDTILKKRPVSFAGCSWDSQSNEQTVVPEIQLNNEEIAIPSDIKRSAEFSNVHDGHDKEKT